VKEKCDYTWKVFTQTKDWHIRIFFQPLLFLGIAIIYFSSPTSIALQLKGLIFSTL
jgi:hypothetical protein